MAVEFNLQHPKAKKETSPGQDFWRRLKRNKAAMVGLVILSILVVVAIFPWQIAPYDYRESNMPASLQAPSAAHWLGTDDLGRDIIYDPRRRNPWLGWGKRLR